MQNIQVLIVVVAAVFSVLRSCEGLKCHQCDTYGSTPEEPQCVDSYKEDNVDFCEDDDTHCVKMKTVATMVDTESGGLIDLLFRTWYPPLIGQVVISRYCRNTPQKSNGCEYRTGASAISITCFCDSDECNSALVSRPSSRLLLLTTFLVLLITTVILRSSS